MMDTETRKQSTAKVAAEAVNVVIVPVKEDNRRQDMGVVTRMQQK